MPPPSPTQWCQRRLREEWRPSAPLNNSEATPTLVSVAAQTSTPRVVKSSPSHHPHSQPWSDVNGGKVRMWTSTSTWLYWDSFPLPETCQTKPAEREGLNKIQRRIPYIEISRFQWEITHHTKNKEDLRGNKSMYTYSLYVHCEKTEMWE